MKRLALIFLMLAGGDQPAPPPWHDPPTIQDCYNHRPYSAAAGPIRQAYNDGFVRSCLRDVAANTSGMVATECVGVGAEVICVSQ